MLKFMVDVVQRTMYRTFVSAKTKDEAMAIALKRAKRSPSEFRKLGVYVNSVKTVTKPPKKLKKRLRPKYRVTT